MKQKLVLLPGWAMHSGMWGDFATQLARHYTLTCLERLPATENLDAACDHILATLDEGPFFLLGWSLGGSIALHLAARYPSRVEGVILVASNPCFIANDTWPGMSPAVFQAFVEQLNQNVSVTLSRFLMLQCQGVAQSSEAVETLNARFNLAKTPPLPALMQGLNLLEKADMRDTLAALSCPVMAIFSDNDRLVPVSVGAAMQARQPALQCHYIEKAGHIPFIAQPQKCVQILCAFIHGARES